jgi:hypothetical protein
VQNLMRTADDRAFVQQDEHAANLLTEWGCTYLQGKLIGLASIERPWGEVVQADRRKRARSWLGAVRAAATTSRITSS